MNDARRFLERLVRPQNLMMNEIKETLQSLHEDIVWESKQGVPHEYERGMRRAARMIAVEIHLIDDVERIEAMTPEELDAELRSHGYDPDSMVAACKRFQERLVRQRSNKD